MNEHLGHVVEQISALLFADRLDTSESFHPAIAPVAPCPPDDVAIKDDLSIKDDVANCLFRRIVCWLNRGNKTSKSRKRQRTATFHPRGHAFIYGPNKPGIVS